MRTTCIGIVTLCLLSAGMAYAQNTAWVARYDGPGNNLDHATAVAVDADGNVYVTGYSRTGTSAGTEDFATIKYKPNGDTAWLRRYNGPGNGCDSAKFIALDADGNVYVTGTSQFDYVTIKYNSDGVEQKVARYDGGRTDYVMGMTIDAAGYVYLTGMSQNPEGRNYFGTVKYDAALGEQWVARYRGPGSSSHSGHAVAVDAAGNVYVVGQSDSISYDYVTIKYNSAGVEQWNQRYDGDNKSGDVPTAIAVDVTSNVYVTGRSPGIGTQTDWATIKYNSAGTQQWVKRYNGPGNASDQAAAIALDADGNVFVTGYSADVDPASWDYLTIKYKPNGDTAWTQRYNGPGNNFDQAYAIAVDAAGNAYVTGTSQGLGTYPYDCVTIKYTPDGNTAWLQRYDGPARFTDEGRAIAADAAGNVCVTGLSRIGTGLTTGDYLTIKYTQVPGRFSLLTPVNHTTDVAVEGDLTWRAATGATNYDVYLGTISPPPLYAENIGNVMTCPYAGLANNTLYYWAVVAKNADGTTRCTEDFDFTTIAAAPEAPVLVSPPHGATNQLTSGTLIWSISARATGYDVYLDVDDPPLELVSENQPERSYEYSGLANDQTYYWKVVARNVGGEAESETRNFTTIIAAPEPFMLALPENNAVNVPLTGDLVWNASTRADWYDVYLDENPDPTTKVGTVNAPAVTLPYDEHVTNGKTYYWKVRAENVGGTTASGVWSFATAVWRDGWTEAKPVPEASSGKPVKDGGWLAIDGTQRVFVAKGNKTGDFYSHDAVLDTWQARESIPAGEAGKNKPPSKGCIGVSDGENFVYMTKGNNTLGFWRYNVDADTWEGLPGVPEGPNRKRVKGGTDMVYAVYKDTGCIILLKGYKTEFYRYNTEAERWDTLPVAPSGGGKAKYDKGSFLAYDPTGYVYAHQAKYNDGANHYMFRFDVLTGLWTDTLKGMPVLGMEGGREKKKKSKDGAAGAWYNGSIYALKGGNTEQFWRCTPGAETAWSQLAPMPLFGDTTEKKKRVKYGADLVSYGYGVFFALKGNKTLDLWRYVEPAYGLQLAANSRSGAMAGNVEVRTSKFELFPNPIANGFAAVRFSLPKAGPVSVKIYDALGRAVLSQAYSVGREASSVSLDLRSLSAGVYLVRLDADGYTASQKLMVQR